MEISVVIPCYKTGVFLDELVRRLKDSLDSLTVLYEIIIVDDGSPDNSWSKIKMMPERNKCVVGIQLSRNFGQHYAISAGLDQAKGNFVVVMDCDLQDQPEEIPLLYAKIKSGFDVVLARRVDRQDNINKRWASILFYKLLSYLTNTIQDPAVANFGIYRRNVISAVLTMGDSIRYFPVMVRWVGFRVVSINVKHAERTAGKSSYNFNKALKLALDVIVGFSDKPLRLVAKLGLFISISSFLGAVYFSVLAFKGEVTVLGWPTLIVSIWFLCGVIIFVLGFIGLYVGKVFEQVKNRPIYIIHNIEKVEPKE